MLYQLLPNVSFGGALKNNIRIGEKVLREFKSEFHNTKSPTMWRHRINNCSSKFEDSTREKLEKVYDSYQKRLDQTRHEIEEVLDRVERMNPTLENRIEGITQVVQKHRFANCGECADIVQFKLIEKGKKAHNIVMHINDAISGTQLEDGDHVFTVIGLSKTAKLNEPKTWGPQAVIVDGWRNIVLGAADALYDLKKFLGFKPSGHEVVYRSADHIDATVRLNKIG